MNASNNQNQVEIETKLQFLREYKLEGNKLDILIYPHTVLSKKALEIDITKITPELINLAKDMLYTLYLAPGVGLAAPQVGKSFRLIVVDVDYTRDKIVSLDLDSEGDNGESVDEDSEEDEDLEEEEDDDIDENDENKKRGKKVKAKYKLDNFHPLVLINPVIVNRVGITKCNEGCLSLPGIHEDVERSLEIDVEYFNLKGEKEFLHATDLLSICIQHECDHLEGMVLLDHLSLLKRNFHKRKLMKRKR
ncbi:MAG: peptide deformylase [Oligoflexia bacterium]|nr:peptide deformylase [Oligoflexia bacterium]